MNDSLHPYRAPPLPVAAADEPAILSREEFDKQQWPIAEQVVLTVDDYLQAMPDSRIPTRSARLAMLLLVPFLIFGAFQSQNLTPVLRWPLAIMAVFLTVKAVLPGPTANRVLLKQQLQKMGREEETVAYEFSPEQLRIINQFQDMRIRWDSFKWWRETNGVLMAYWNELSYQIFPTAKFSPLGASALRALLHPDKRVP